MLTGSRFRPIVKDAIIVAVGVAIIWGSLMAIFGTQNPFYVVSSGSMIPALQVYDIIVVQGNDPFEQVKEGDIIVFDRPSDHSRVPDVVPRLGDLVSGGLGRGGQVLHRRIVDARVALQAPARRAGQRLVEVVQPDYDGRVVLHACGTALTAPSWPGLETTRHLPASVSSTAPLVMTPLRL